MTLKQGVNIGLATVLMVLISYWGIVIYARSNPSPPANSTFVFRPDATSVHI